MILLFLSWKIDVLLKKLIIKKILILIRVFGNNGRKTIILFISQIVPIVNLIIYNFENMYYHYNILY